MTRIGMDALWDTVEQEIRDKLPTRMPFLSLVFKKMGDDDAWRTAQRENVSCSCCPIPITFKHSRL